MNTIKHSPLYYYAAKRGFEVAREIDRNVGIVLRPRAWWIPKFLYKAVVKQSVEIVRCGPLVDMAYEPEL
jgi:hypothetical protein